MALSLTVAESKVRTRTRHVGDTTRLTQAQAREFLHDSYVAVRQWLQDVAPELYIVNSGDIVAAAGDSVSLTSDDHIFDRIYKVQYLPESGSLWCPVEAADPLYYNQHQLGTFTWRREADTIYIGPDDRDSLTIQVLYYEVPAELTLGADEFAVPGCLEMALILGACATTAMSDGDDPTPFLKMRAGALGEAAIALRRRNGIHSQNAGLRRVRGY